MIFIPTTLSLSNNQKNLTRPIPTKYYCECSLKRIFILAQNEPLARIIRNNNTIHPILSKSVDLFRRLNNIMDNRRKTQHPLACNLFRDRSWVNTSRQTISSRQIGIVTDEKCDIRLDGEQLIEDNEVEDDFIQTTKDIIINTRHALFNAISSIPQLEELSNRPDLLWNNGFYEMKDWILERDGQTCSLNRLSMLHKNGSFYFFPEITNNPVDKIVPDKERQGVIEFVKEDFSGSLKMIHPIYNTTIPGGGIGINLVVQGSTIISRWGGRAALASVGNMNFDQNPTLIQAFRRNEKTIDIASDSITGSNIAILALPMVMTLLPVAFITELPSLAMLTYVIFTDIFSVIPFLIKGMELIETSSNNDIFASYRSGTMKMGQTEIWIGSCQGENNFQKIGITFVVISLVTIMMALGCEILATRYVRRRRLQGERDYHGPFGIKPSWQLYGPLQDENEDVFEEQYELERFRRYSDEKTMFEQDEKQNKKIIHPMNSNLL